MHSHALPLPLLSCLLACLLPLCGCQNTEQATLQPAIELSHQWNVPPGLTLFTQNNFGSDPAAAAEQLMPSIPNVVYRLGERCKDDPAFAKPGTLTIELTLRGKAATEVALQPASTGAECVRNALNEEFAAEKTLADLGSTPTRILLYLEHAPTSTS